MKLTDFNKTIENFYTDYEGINLINYRYNIEPLGFSLQNDNMVVANAFVYNKKSEKIFMGSWGYDLTKREIRLLSTNNTSQEISANGLVLKQSLE